MTEDKDAPKRLRAGDVIDQQHAALMAALTKTSGQGATVELTRNAKGDVQIAVKVSDDDPKTAEHTARTIFDGLRNSYPYGAS